MRCGKIERNRMISLECIYKSFIYPERIRDWNKMFQSLNNDIAVIFYNRGGGDCEKGNSLLIWLILYRINMRELWLL